MSEQVEKQYVDWSGLRYYDQKVKEYADDKYSSKAEQDQLRTDLEQTEQRLETVSQATQTAIEHILTHVEQLEAASETIASSVEQLQEDVKNINGGVLPSDLATKEFVLDEIEKAKLASTVPSDSYITEEDLDSKGYITAEDIPPIPTKTSELVNDAGYLTEHQDVSHLATKEELRTAIDSLEQTSVDLTDYARKEDLSAVEAKIPSVEGLATKEELLEAINSIEHPTIDLSGYVTDEELASQGFVTTESIVNLATVTQVNELQTRVTEFENNVTNNYITIEDGVTREELDTAVADVVSSQVETIIDEKIEEVVTNGATVSSIAYDEF